MVLYILDGYIQINPNNKEEIIMNYVKPVVATKEIGITPRACTSNFTCSSGFSCDGYTCKVNFKCTGW